MPLVVPGITNNSGGNLQQQWMEKLAGKKLTDEHTETSFARKDLPKQHRVVESGNMMTMDHNPDRMNIHVGKDGTVQKVEFK